METCLSRTLSSLLLLFPLSSSLSGFPEIFKGRESLDNQEALTHLDFDFHKEEEFHFDPNHVILETGAVQTSQQVIHLENIDDFPFTDHDNQIVNLVKENDKILLIRSMGLIKYGNPETVDAKFLASEQLLKQIPDKNSELVCPKTPTIATTIDIKIQKLRFDMHYSSYNFLNQTGHEMDEGTASLIIEKFSLNEKPNVVVAIKTNPEDVHNTSYSYGGWTILFFQEKGDDTIIESYTLLTVKSNSISNLIWNKFRVENSIFSRVQEISKMNIAKMRRYFSSTQVQ